jgi:xylan 1,4-beta-xylosidase
MKKIRNPVLPGFNPDPSILRVNDDYYIATSTFEWFPGVQIHHSKDLVNWRLLTHPVTRTSQLDMRGNISSSGVWAPCLSYHDGMFYLIYSNVRSYKGPFKDVYNYLITAKNIEGPWSEPIFLNSSGFDPSLFHDDDGKKWFVNMLWDHRKLKLVEANPDDGANEDEHAAIKGCFAGIVIQQYDPKTKKLVGPVKNIFQGTKIGLVEGPHIYKRNGFYYLLTAEGGTFYKHAVTMARSKNLFGPYEADPSNPLLTSAGKPELELQKAGHGSLVETQKGEWYLAHLCGRPFKSKTEPKLRCMLGRETAIQKCEWTNDGWLKVKGGNFPSVMVEPPALPAFEFKPESTRDNFDSDTLGVHLNTLRIPADPSWLSLKERPGYLRLKGRESLASPHEQSLVARRITSFKCRITTSVEFEPDNFQQMAGLILFYDIQNYFYLRISSDEKLGKHLGIVTSDNGAYSELRKYEIKLGTQSRYFLKADYDNGSLQFSYSSDEKKWEKIGPSLDATRLSDEYCKDGCFTGTFIGLCCQDLSGTHKHADFDFFEYKES